jgi:hypothetical protein
LLCGAARMLGTTNRVDWHKPIKLRGLGCLLLLKNQDKLDKISLLC